MGGGGGGLKREGMYVYLQLILSRNLTHIVKQLYSNTSKTNPVKKKKSQFSGPIPEALPLEKTFFKSVVKV